MIHVNAIGAEEIPNFNKDRKSNLHLVVTIGSMENSQKTKTISNTQYPNWDETLSFILKNSNTQMIQCILYDSDSFLKAEPVSSVVLSTADFEFGKIYDNWYDLKPYKGLVKGGRLHLRVQICPKDHKAFTIYSGKEQVTPANKYILPPLKKAGQSILNQKCKLPISKNMTEPHEIVEFDFVPNKSGPSQIEDELNVLKTKSEQQKPEKVEQISKPTISKPSNMLFPPPPVQNDATNPSMPQHYEFIEPSPNPYQYPQQYQYQQQYQYPQQNMPQFQYQYPQYPQETFQQFQFPNQYQQQQNNFNSAQYQNQQNFQYQQQGFYQVPYTYQPMYPPNGMQPGYVTAAPIYNPPQMYSVPPKLKKGSVVLTMISPSNPMFGAVPKAQPHQQRQYF